MAPVLEGVRVVELTEALAGPYCAMLLGDMGADVIKVERQGVGDQSRTWGPPFVGTECAYFLATNRNKRSIALDYDQASGYLTLHQLIASADIFLCNQPSLESLQRRGIDPETLRLKYPRLIQCSISGYGLTGPNAGKHGYDIMAQAEAGLMSFTGEPDGGPMRFPVAIADLTTGIYASMGILGALYAREKTGVGDYLDMALFDSQLTWLSNIGSTYLNTEASPERWGNAHPSIVPYQPFQGKEGKLFVLGVGTQAVWHRLLRMLNLWDELGTDSRFQDNASRVKNREALVPLLQLHFAARPSTYWLTKLAEAKIPAAAIQTVGEALSDPQTIGRGLIVELEHSTLKTVRSIANPIRYQRQAMVYRLPPPLLGEHTEQILQELGTAKIHENNSYPSKLI